MIGSHNSLTYLSVRQWYYKPFKFVAKCQSKPIYEQFCDYGVRVFDIRIRFKNGEPIVAHGPIEFKCDVLDYIEQINNLADKVFFLNQPVYVRLILESNKKMKDQSKQQLLFYEFCEYCLANYKNIRFFGGNRKYDWEKIYLFKDDIELIDKYSSTTSIFGGKKDNFIAKIDDFWPWLYAKLYNKKNYAKYDGTGVLFLDFVNIK